MKVGVIFGGRSCEHDISIITGVMTANAAKQNHSVVPIYIGGDGVWYTGRGLDKVTAFAKTDGNHGKNRTEKSTENGGKSGENGCKNGENSSKNGENSSKNDENGCKNGENSGENGENRGEIVAKTGVNSGKNGSKKCCKGCKKKRVHLLPGSRGLFSKFGRKIADLDAVIICCHGVGGEDGTIAGLLDLCGIPYVGSGVLASAVGMDKIAQKMLYQNAGIAVTPFIGVNRHDLHDDFFDLAAEVNTKLSFPLIVKPAGLGSSIGIGRAQDFKQLFQRLDEAFLWDNRVIIENALTDFIEVNCAVLGCDGKLVVSQIEQPLSDGFLSYQDKYESGGKGDTRRYLPAHISPETGARVREKAKKVFSLLGCSGVARIDFLIKDDVIYVNEINTVPGSLSSYLFAFDGMDFPLLIDKLLLTATQRQKSRDRLKHTYDSDVLRNFGGGGKSG